MLSDPTNAKEALDVWRECVMHIDDADVSTSMDAYMSASIVLEFVEIEKISLEELVREESERKLLNKHATLFGDFVDNFKNEIP